MPSFKSLGLSDPILKVIGELGFEKPSDIQEQSIPVLLAETTDYIGLAQTGTGKTAAFGLPLLERLNPKDKFTQSLILAPTRELGKQIAEQLEIFSKYLPNINVLPVYGGANIVTQIKALKKPTHVIIATPGRLIDLIKRKAVKLDQLHTLVLDEADEMLNMGFKEDIDTILSYTPDTKNTWLFSATMPKAIKKIVQKYMEDPVEVRIDASTQVNVNIEHQYVKVRHSDKMEALTRFIDLNPAMRAVVFCRTKRDTQGLAEDLLKNNYKADAIHGDLSQTQRDRVMKRFKNQELKLLIATDVAARGIDVNDLTHVFHYSLPDDAAYYTHRSGRTARAGKKGISLSFISGREKGRIERFSRSLKINFEQVLIPEADQIEEIRLGNWAQDIANYEDRKGVSKEVFAQVTEVLDDLSKDELISRLLSIELDKISVGSKKALNRESQDRGRSSGSRGHRGSDRREKRGDRRGGGGSRSTRRTSPRFEKKEYTDQEPDWVKRKKSYVKDKSSEEKEVSELKKFSKSSKGRKSKSKARAAASAALKSKKKGKAKKKRKFKFT